ncbi:hypothetical protein ACFQDN_21535 [Pseudomonas asuensis]
MAVSQYLEDYPPELLNAATSVYVVRGGSSSDADVLRKTFKVSEETIARLERECVGHTNDGANFLALFKTRLGSIAQILTNSVGPLELWASSSSHDDTALRDRLYKALGSYKARKFLASRFPLGRASHKFEQMRLQAGENNAGSVVQILANELLDEYEREQTERGQL